MEPFSPRNILLKAVNLASFVDSANLPTTGLRLEIPAELGNNFKLLALLGTHFWTRHDEGTKRYVKFDDYDASLFINIKQWPRQTSTRRN